MRYCPNCRRISEGWPERCFFCACTWNIRKCRSGHDNPHTALFCGTCGSADLSTPALGGRTINWFFHLPYSNKSMLKIVIIGLGLLFIIGIAQNIDAFLPLLLGIIFLLIAGKYLSSFFPIRMTRVIKKLYRWVMGNNTRARKAR